MQQEQENKETDSDLGKAWYPNMIQYYSFIIKLDDRESRDKTSIHRYTYIMYKNIYVKY